MRISFHTSCIAITLFSFACAEQMNPSGTAGSRLKETVVLEETESALQVCPDGPTTFGIDVSRWQSTIDWNQVVEDGVKYAVIRVSNGTSDIDQEFIANWTNSRQAGILRGAYQYFRPGQDPIEQANHMINALRAQGDIGELPPVIDVEETDDQAPSVVRAKVRAWIDHVQTELNVRPMIYSGRYFWGPSVCGGDLSVCRSFAEYPLWHPQYGSNPVDPPQNVEGRSCPNISDTWTRWDFWQYGSQGRIQGIGNGRSNVDLNVFNGTYEDLLAFATRNGGGMWTPPPVWGGRPRGQSFPLAADEPIQLCRGERMSGEIYVENNGNQSWGEEVVLAPTPRDQDSELFSPSWLSRTRVTSADNRVEPGERGVFVFEIEAQREGLINQTFNLVAEGVLEGTDLWFSDSGGPHDGYLELKAEGQVCAEDLEGSIEVLNCDGIQGYAMDSAVPNRFVRVELIISIDGDEPLRAEVIADSSSADSECQGEFCRHQFSFTWPESVNPSEIELSNLEVVAHGWEGTRLTLTTPLSEIDCASEMGAGEGAEAGAEAGVEAGVESGIEGGAAGATLDSAGEMMTEGGAGEEAIMEGGMETLSEAGAEEEMAEMRRSSDTSGCAQSHRHISFSWLFMLLIVLKIRRNLA